MSGHLHAGAATRSQAEARLHRQESTVSKLFDPPPAVVQSAESLKGLAAEVNAASELGDGHTRKGLPHYRQAGDALIKAKARVKHGEWLKWLKDHVKCSPARCRAYMALARNWSKLLAASNLNEAMRLLADETPEGEKEEAVPAHLEPVLESGELFRKAARKSVEAANALRDAEESAGYRALEDWEQLHFKKKDKTGRVNSTFVRSYATHIESIAPEGLCPACHGIPGSKDADVCGTCQGRGFLIHQDKPREAT